MGSVLGPLDFFLFSKAPQSLAKIKPDPVQINHYDLKVIQKLTDRLWWTMQVRSYPPLQLRVTVGETSTELVEHSASSLI